MEIQRGKEVMKSQHITKEVGATTSCPFGAAAEYYSTPNGSVNHGIRCDAWFGSFQTENEVALCGHKAVF
jgi:hypothetical protein